MNMGLFKRNSNNEEFLTILSEIRDQLKINNDDVLKELEGKIADVHYSNDEELGVLANRVEEQSKIIKLQTEQLDENYNLIIKMQNDYEDLKVKHYEMVKVMTKYTNLIKDFITDNPVEEIEEIPKQNHIRNIKPCINVKPETIDGLNKDGTFKRKGKGKRTFKWNIHTIIKLKKIIPNLIKYPTLSSLAQAVGLSASTTSDLVYWIEEGFFDQYLNEWEQMQMKKHFGNWKPPIENNPEKRKEKGYV